MLVAQRSSPMTNMERLLRRIGTCTLLSISRVGHPLCGILRIKVGPKTQREESSEGRRRSPLLYSRYFKRTMRSHFSVFLHWGHPFRKLYQHHSQEPPESNSKGSKEPGDQWRSREDHFKKIRMAGSSGSDRYCGRLLRREGTSRPREFVCSKEYFVTKFLCHTHAEYDLHQRAKNPRHVHWKPDYTHPTVARTYNWLKHCSSK